MSRGIAEEVSPEAVARARSRAILAASTLEEEAPVRRLHARLNEAIDSAKLNHWEGFLECEVRKPYGPFRVRVLRAAYCSFEPCKCNHTRTKGTHFNRCKGFTSRRELIFLEGRALVVKTIDKLNPDEIRQANRFLTDN